MSEVSLDSIHLARFNSEHGFDAEMIHLQEETLTVAAAAAALRVTPEQIIKSVLFLADSEPVLVIASGTTRIDRKRLAAHLGVSRRRIKIASGEQVLSITGYPVGAVPPYGHKQSLRTVVDSDVLGQSIVYGGGGEIRCLMRLSVADLRQAVGNEVADLTEDSRPAQAESR